MNVNQSKQPQICRLRSLSLLAFPLLLGAAPPPQAAIDPNDLAAKLEAGWAVQAQANREIEANGTPATRRFFATGHPENIAKVTVKGIIPQAPNVFVRVARATKPMPQTQTAVIKIEIEGKAPSSPSSLFDCLLTVKGNQGLVNGCSSIAGSEPPDPVAFSLEEGSPGVGVLEKSM